MSDFRMEFIKDLREKKKEKKLKEKMLRS